MPLFSLKAIEPVDLTTLTRPSSPNSTFVAPPDFSRARRDAEAPLFACNWTRLAEAWDRAVTTFPRTAEHNRSSDGRQRTYVQRTALMGYPDVITIEFVALEDNQSSVAIYSRSQYGYSDFGANRRRVNAWLRSLTETLSASEGP